MIEFDLEKYISYVKDTLGSSIDDFYIEKDYLLSLFLSTWQNLKVKGEISALDELIFKVGSLIIKNFFKRFDDMFKGKNKRYLQRQTFWLFYKITTNLAVF